MKMTELIELLKQEMAISGDLEVRVEIPGQRYSGPQGIRRVTKVMDLPNDYYVLVGDNA